MHKWLELFIIRILKYWQDYNALLYSLSFIMTNHYSFLFSRTADSTVSSILKRSFQGFILQKFLREILDFTVSFVGPRIFLGFRSVFNIVESVSDRSLTMLKKERLEAESTSTLNVVVFFKKGERKKNNAAGMNKNQYFPHKNMHSKRAIIEE